MAEIRAEEAARLEDARLRVRQSRSATSNVLRSQQREHKHVDKEKHISLIIALHFGTTQTAIDMMPSDTHKIIIHADRMPAGEHVRRFNAPTVDEVAIIIVGDQFQPRDIVLHRRNEQLIKVAETHRCYDVLQYPILFWDGAVGYNFSFKM
ncbi:uncharacterized protein NPIL_38011, partial [Nephila pilipes]